MKIHWGRLTLANRQRQPVWFLVPTWLDRPLSEEGVFRNTSEDPRFAAFEATEYDGDGGSVVSVRMNGLLFGFSAFRLPVGGQVEFGGYSFFARSNFSHLVVLESLDLKVNGKTSLEKWLPFVATSGAKVSVSEWVFRMGGKSLEWNPKRNDYRQDFPNEKVQDVTAEGLRIWTLEFLPKNGKQTP
jgi:hypothetical protein